MKNSKIACIINTTNIGKMQNEAIWATCAFFFVLHKTINK